MFEYPTANKEFPISLDIPCWQLDIGLRAKPASGIETRHVPSSPPRASRETGTAPPAAENSDL